MCLRRYWKQAIIKILEIGLQSVSEFDDDGIPSILELD
jgi:hypothetical protein